MPANESTSESIKELRHGCREVAVLVYQGYNDGIEGDVHHTGDVRQEALPRYLHYTQALSKLLGILFSKAYNLKVPVYANADRDSTGQRLLKDDW